MNSSIEEQLLEQGFFVSTTVGSSMRPMLRNRRDRVVVRAIGEKTLKKYDLPLYRLSNGKYVMHRIIGVKDDCYVIRGDNTYQKEIVLPEQILGYVTEFYRGGRRIASDSRAYRVYAVLWNWIYPIRAAWHAFRGFASRVKHKLLKT